MGRAAPGVGLMIVDFYRADVPWIVYEYIPHKYATNPVIDILRNNGKSYEHRVSAPSYGGLPGQAGQDQGMFLQIYHVWWLQYNFQYYNIQGPGSFSDASRGGLLPALQPRAHGQPRPPLGRCATPATS